MYAGAGEWHVQVDEEHFEVYGGHVEVDGGLVEVDGGHVEFDGRYVVGHVGADCWEIEAGVVVTLAGGWHVGSGIDIGGCFCVLDCCYHIVVGSCSL